MGQDLVYAYDNVGNRKSQTLPNGVTTSYVYDDLNRLTHMESRNLSGDVLTSYTYLAVDQTGGVYVVWQEQDAGKTGIYAQRFSAQGAALWSAPKRVASPVSPGDHAPSVVAHDSGAYIAWVDAPSGAATSKIFVQRFNSDGAPLWDAIRAGDSENAQLAPAFALDSLDNGVVAVWREAGAAADSHVYAPTSQHLAISI